MIIWYGCGWQPVLVCGSSNHQFEQKYFTCREVGNLEDVRNDRLARHNRVVTERYSGGDREQLPSEWNSLESWGPKNR